MDCEIGEIVFLGSPRGEFNGDITNVLNYCHLYNRGCITFKGSTQWRYPVEPNEFVKHSLVRNSNIVFDLMARNKLQIEPLISHVLAPNKRDWLMRDYGITKMNISESYSTGHNETAYRRVQIHYKAMMKET